MYSIQRNVLQILMARNVAEVTSLKAYCMSTNDHFLRDTIATEIKNVFYSTVIRGEKKTVSNNNKLY